MVDLIRRLKLVAAFVVERHADYAQLASLEWGELSRLLLRVICGGAVAFLALVFFLGFLSLAVIVSAWDSTWRVPTAWLVAVGWLALCAGVGAVVLTASRRLRPFERVREELSRDVAVVRTAL